MSVSKQVDQILFKLLSEFQKETLHLFHKPEFATETIVILMRFCAMLLVVRYGKFKEKDREAFWGTISKAAYKQMNKKYGKEPFDNDDDVFH